jgi:hypothetical protein
MHYSDTVQAHLWARQVELLTYRGTYLHAQEPSAHHHGPCTKHDAEFRRWKISRGTSPAKSFQSFKRVYVISTTYRQRAMALLALASVPVKVVFP